MPAPLSPKTAAAGTVPTARTAQSTRDAGATGSGIGYLPGLDGLRAVAVVAVIAYHLDLTWATGGYLGVEVFFVVSGYLITAMLVDEHHRHGAVDRAGFWMRRARRLLPAVVVAIVAVLTYALVVLEPGAAGRIRGDGLASLLYVQNWHAVLTDEPYFATFGRPSPFRHLWSLAIEEQFYLLWPLVLPVVLRRSGRTGVARLAVAGALGSILVMVAVADVGDPERAYLGTDARAFGILLGAALAVAWRPDRIRRQVGPGARRSIDVAGMAALGALAWQFGHRSEFDPWTYPWGFLIVDACTIALVVASTHPASRIRHGLGSPALAWLGRRSYSLYLWHWPVFTFTRPGTDWGLDGGTSLVARLVLAAVLAEASYRWIEQPFRDGRAQDWLWSVSDRANDRRLLAPLVGGLALVAVVLATVVVTAPSTPVDALAGPDVSDSQIVSAASPDPAAATTTSPTTPTTSPTTTTTSPTTTTAGPPVTEAAVAYPDITVLGESVTVGATAKLGQVYGRRVLVDAAEGRSFDDGAETIETMAADGTLTPIVIVHLGTNGPIPPGGLDRILAAVGPQRRLILVTVHVPGRWEGEVNEAVRNFVAGCANCAVADWFTMASQEPDLVTTDDVHLTAIGEIRYVDLLVSVTG